MNREPSSVLAFGVYPQRLAASDAPALEAAWRALCSRFTRPAAARLPRPVALAYAAGRERLGRADAAELESETQSVRARLLRRDADAEATGTALALAAAAMQRTLGMTPYDTQVLAAWLMLRGRLVEMATGEGKTLTAGLAAAVAALGGAPVHVLTANDYLVQRDRDTLAPFFSALGLNSACVTGATAPEARARAWRQRIVYSTARELVFDYLRDHLTLRGERDALVLRANSIAAHDAAARAADPSQAPRGGTGAAAPALPGLCFCLVDEADSILLDEAVVPLILAAPSGALDAAGYRLAYEISCALQRQRDYTLVHERRAASLSQAGRERVAAAVQGAGGVLAPARRACELVEAALAARLLFRRDRDYVVAGDKLQLIDELTGRIADGRQWQGALHPMAEIKEGLAPSAPTATAAQITYQRFFPRYLKLCGMSGTLLEARHELRVAYDATVQRVPLARASRRVMQRERCYVDAAHKWQAVLHAVREQVACGRPVLVGTDSVADSAHLSALLHASGVPHQLLNAVQDADEAQRIARAGCAAMVTVATNIAGRGTDIKLDAAAAKRGGLHVIATMRNRSRRIDRQLFGRAARHGDPGSAQTLLALDDALLVRHWPAQVLRAVTACACALARADGSVPAWLARPLFGVAQRLAEWRDQRLRRALRHADRRTAENFGFSGGTE
jgi:preprotein translocase subunit SecA